MSIINSLLGVFLGNKYERDIKEINPYVEKIHEEYGKLQSLSNDELRNRSEELRKEILGGIAELENEVRDLKSKAEKEEDVDKKEDLYNQVDKVEKLINDRIEEELDKAVPRAFA
jgi:preprotein translocase subunit SecA